MLIPIHFCGMAVDWVRRCYWSYMRLAHDQPPVLGKWFRVPDDTPFIPGPNPWGSSNWTERDAYDGIGEQVEIAPCSGNRVREWAKQEAPAVYDGEDYCGSAEALRYGGFVGQDEFFWTNSRGQAPCCETPLIWDGGLVLGGEAAQVVAPGQPGAGGLRLGGTASQTLSVAQRGAGGLRLGGDAFQALAVVQRAAGGLRLAGIALQILGVGQVGGGGLLLGGEAQQILGVGQPGGGGLILAGDGQQVIGVGQEGIGGVDMGGLAAQIVGTGQAADGGLAAGGLIAQGLAVLQSSEGGLAVAGDAPQAAAPIQQGDGGLVVGGEADQHEEGGGGGGPPCATSNTYSVTVAGVTGAAACASANKTYSMTWTSGQLWTTPVVLWWAALDLAASPPTLTFTRGTLTATYQCASFDCATGGTFTFVSNVGCSGWPAVLSVANP